MPDSRTRRPASADRPSAVPPVIHERPVLDADDAAVSRAEGPRPRRPAAVPDGRLLRDVRRGRRARLRPARPGPDDPRQGAERRADGRASPTRPWSRTWPSSSRPGQRAAVCEQVEDPKLAKGLVKREVVRVVTPGTLTDEALLDPRTANYLAAVVEVGGKLGLAWVELSTGRFSLTGVSRTELADEIARLNPAETLVSETAASTPPGSAPSAASRRLAVTTRPSWDFQAEQARKALFEHFGTTTLAGFGVDDDAPEVQAAGALVAYLRETQKSSIGHITRLTPYRRADDPRRSTR